MNNQSHTISSEQRNTLNNYINNDDRTGFYVALHSMTGSQAALDMAEISSSSGLRGGGAWAVNTLYSSAGVAGYPEGGVREFSVEIAIADFRSFKDNGDGSYSVPGDLESMGSDSIDFLFSSF